MQHFGSGLLVGKVTGGNNLPANQTGRIFGILQDISIDFDFDLKPLYGQYQMPVGMGRGKMKIPGKAKIADIRARMYNDLFWGQTVSTGQLLTNFDFPSVVAATVTIVPPGSGVFAEDLGVRNASTGASLEIVPSAPATGQYSVVPATGVYTFAVADVGIAILINYTYTIAASGLTMNLTNQLMGYAPEFEVVLQQTFNGKQMNTKLVRCMSSKLATPTKQDDWTIPEFDFQAFAPLNAATPAIIIGAAE